MSSAGVERGGGAAIGGDITYVGGGGVLLQKKQGNIAVGMLFVGRGARAIYRSWALPPTTCICTSISPTAMNQA